MVGSLLPEVVLKAAGAILERSLELWRALGSFFPVRALAQGSLCVRFPSCRGWSSRDSADFRSTKIVVRSPSLEKISEFLTKKVLKISALPERISVEAVVWLKNASRPKIGFQKCNSSRKIVVPEPRVFSIENRLPL